MKIITVRSQEELNLLPESFDEYTIIQIISRNTVTTEVGVGVVSMEKQ